MHFEASRLMTNLELKFEVHFEASPFTSSCKTFFYIYFIYESHSLSFLSDIATNMAVNGLTLTLIFRTQVTHRFTSDLQVRSICDDSASNYNIMLSRTADVSNEFL